MLRKIIALCLVLLLVVLYFLFIRTVKRETTFYPIANIPFTVAEYGRSQAEFDEDIKLVKERVSQLERIFSLYRDDSELVQFNKVAHLGTYEVSAELSKALNRSKFWHESSDGAFDPTITPLTVLWKKAEKDKKIPSSDQIARAISNVGMDRVINSGENEFRFTKKGITVDLGGIAKGVFVDDVKEMLLSRGVKAGIVNFGGNGVAFGNRIFSFGIQDPLSELQDKIIGKVYVESKGVVTSGNYRRYFEIDGRRYSHILDPKTGMSSSGLISVTVIAPNATDADALATALSVMGKTDAITWLNNNSEISAVLIDEGADGIKKVYVSKSIAGSSKFIGEWQKTVEVF